MPLALGEAAVLLLDAQQRPDAGKQHRLGAQHALDLVLRDALRLEVLHVRPDAHARPRRGADALGSLAQRRQRLGDLAAVGEDEAVGLAAAADVDLEPGRQRVGHRNADPVQAARKLVGGARVLLVELAAGVQFAEDELHRRHLLDRMEVDRDAAAIVLDGNGVVEEEHHRDAARETGERLVGGVVDHFLEDVRARVGTRVHPGPELDRFESAQDVDVAGAVVVARSVGTAGFGHAAKSLE